MVYMYHSFLVHSSADGHLGRLHVIMWFFLVALLLLPFFVTTLSCLHWVLWLDIQSLSSGGRTNICMVNYFFIYISLLHFCVCWQGPHLVVDFVQCCVGFSLGDGEVTRPQCRNCCRRSSSCLCINEGLPSATISDRLPKQWYGWLFMLCFRNMKARSIVFILYNYSQLPDAGKDRRQEEKATTEDEMVGWASSGRRWRTGKPVVLSPQGHKELDMIEWLNNIHSWFTGIWHINYIVGRLVLVK